MSRKITLSFKEKQLLGTLASLVLGASIGLGLGLVLLSVFISDYTLVPFLIIILVQSCVLIKLNIRAIKARTYQHKLDAHPLPVRL